MQHAGRFSWETRASESSDSFLSPVRSRVSHQDRSQSTQVIGHPCHYTWLHDRLVSKVPITRIVTPFRQYLSHANLPRPSGLLVSWGGSCSHFRADEDRRISSGTMAID
ncbi:hypothetical protein N7468_007522 [Penicillium chermesinum]|uniref:Uncharacterized protein n=1 Tax=Penicillium chermesinum TaxID=63820 RepID=A0A9W9NUJ6_9EURO|nr:uncharacterized protein N7468_007522 [Penicillium chermesinum]KAJ5226297.1 hypothetical protein N7468_007522 [Penicillium chermesinum]